MILYSYIFSIKYKMIKNVKIKIIPEHNNDIIKSPWGHQA